MRTVDANPMAGWPRVRRLRPGVCRVQGRVVSVLRWLVLQRLMRWTVLLGCLWLLGAALLPILVPVFERIDRGNPLSLAIQSMIDARLLIRELLTDRYPHIGQMIYYTGRSPCDWHLLAVFIIAMRLRTVVGTLISSIVAVVIWPLLTQRFKVTFYRDVVVVHHALRSIKLPRKGTHGGVSFRVAGPEYHTGFIAQLLRSGKLKPGAAGDFCMVMALVGRRQIPIASPRRQYDAERIVQSCQVALGAGNW